MHKYPHVVFHVHVFSILLQPVERNRTMLSLWETVVESRGENWRYLLESALKEMGNNEVAQKIFRSHGFNGIEKFVL